MICYKDQAYCVSPNCRNECGRQLTDEIVDLAIAAKLPINMAYFCGEPESQGIEIESNDKGANDER